MNVGNQLSRRELSARGPSLQTSVPELMDVLERTFNDARELDTSVHAAPIFRGMAKHLRSASSILGRISNMQTPNGRLPDKVLTRILLFAKLALRDVFVDRGCVMDPCRWRHLLRVCSRWTTIIHADPRFWSSIDLTWNRTTIDRFLSLSGDTLLSLRIPASAEFPLDRQNFLLSIVRRAKDISITHHSRFNDCRHTRKPRNLVDTSYTNSASSTEDAFAAIRCLAESLIAPAPHLSRLSVICSTYSFSGSFCPPLQHLSSLTSLELHDCELGRNWNARAMFPASLRRIHFAYRSPDHSSAKSGIDIVDIIDLIGHCPELNSLDITGIHVNPAPPNFQIRNKGNISALQLRYLSIDGMSSSEWDFLSYLILAPFLFEIHFTIPSKSQMSLLPAFLCLSAAQASHATLVFECSVITCTYSGRQTANNLDFKHVISIPCKPYHPFFPDYQPNRAQVVDQIISFAQLNCLTIEINRGTGLRWGTLLENMSCLVALNVRGFIGPEFFEALAGRTNTVMVCPQLLSLGVQTSHHCFDRGTATMEWRWCWTDPWEESRSHLWNCLSWRMLRGYKLKKLITHPQWLAGGNIPRLLMIVDIIEGTDGPTIWFWRACGRW